MTGNPYTILQPALARLDRLLAGAVEATAVVFGEVADRFRGLYIPPEEAARLLHGDPVRWPLLPETSGAAGPAWSRLQALYALDAFDLDVLLLALAPSLDRRYERLYAYLQDHVAYTAPTVALALNLLAPQQNRLQWRTRFLPGSPLLRHGLITLVADANARQPSLLSHFIRPDAQVVAWLLDDPTPDARLAQCCVRLERDTVITPPLWATALARAWTEEAPLRLRLTGRSGVGKRDVAAAAAGALDTALWWIDVQGIPVAELQPALQAAVRHARCHGLLPYITGLEAVAGQPVQRQQWGAILEADGRPLLVGTTEDSEEGPAMISVPVVPPDFTTRRRVWQRVLGTDATSVDLDALAGRFRLGPHQIRSIAGQAQWLEGPLEQRLFALARARSAADLGGLAQKISTLYTWEDLVLPADSLAQLRELCARVARRHTVLGQWGFGAQLSSGTGVNALFAGPTGTGKTMAAEVIANALRLDLYKIDLSGVVSKYIGETEKNLNRIFAAAEGSSAILFFDEADALFGKRSEVRDSHDRYANIEISYLLQKMEEYDGISILTTNLRHNLDDAFVRRLAFTVHFPFPDAPSREAIWRGIWPEGAPLAADLDFSALAQAHKLSGGNIKNVALAAAFLAAEDGGVVRRAHILHAVRREYQKLGKTIDLNGAGYE